MKWLKVRNRALATQQRAARAALSTLSYFALTNHNLVAVPFLIGSALCIFGLCVIVPANSGLYTKTVENQGGAQGLFGGIWSVFMSAGKSVGPLVAGQSLAYIDECDCHWVVFAFCSPVLLANLILFPFIIEKAKALEDRVQEIKNEKEEAALIGSRKEGGNGDGNDNDLTESLLKDVVE